MKSKQIYRSKHAAFTLVELLVVIGIIALLISVLLPALGKARAQANSVDCQSRLHQVGLALSIYETNTKGLLPWGVIDRMATVPPTYPGQYAQRYWWWYQELALTMDRNYLLPTGVPQNLPGIFNDRDAIATTDGSSGQIFTANPRVFWQNNNQDGDPTNPNYSTSGFTQGNDVPQYHASRLGSGSTFLIWDAPQCFDQGGNAYGLATELDDNALTYGHCFDNLYDPNTTYNRPVNPYGLFLSESASVCKSLQKKYNFDQQLAFQNWVGIRFRHLYNTSMNCLCGDGHIETRKVGAAMLTDFFVKSPY